MKKSRIKEIIKKMEEEKMLNKKEEVKTGKTKVEKKVKKEAKKKEKKFKKLKNLVSSELFGSRLVNDPTRESLIEGITKAVGVHKTLNEREKESLKNRESFYYDELFSEFKELVKNHNDKLAFNADKLIQKISKLEKELKEKTEESEKVSH
jgi:hypothetical protein